MDGVSMAGCVYELIEARASRCPDDVAVVCGDRVLSYRELDGWAERVAGRLRAAGTGVESLVGVCAERGVGLVAGLLGVWKAGGAYVPLDPVFPPARLGQLVADTGLGVVLTQSGLSDRLPAGPRLFDVDDDDPAAGAGAEGVSPRGSAGPEHLAYVMFTSGSTGRPKGVQIEHRGITNRLLWAQDRYRLTADDVVLHKTPYSFDVSVWELFWPLIVGARLVLAAPGDHRSPDAIAAAIDRHRVTVAHFVPTMLDQFLANRAPGSGATLTKVLASGEALTGHTVQRFHDTFSGVELHNLYGPTEASIDVTAWQCEAGADPNTPPPIGHPISNTDIHILDRHLEPVPPGAVGQIYVAGAGLARGYHNQPGQTADHFVPNPFTSQPAARLYRTGDLAHRAADGTIHYRGRTDHELKIHGVRTHPAEIEAAILAHPAIAHTTVQAHQQPPHPPQLVAYLVPHRGAATPDVTELQAHLKNLLPPQLIPNAYVSVPHLPTTPNGKLDVRALPAPTNQRPALATAYTPPRTATQQTIATIWTETLGITAIGTDDNFFELGGHSLTAIQVAARLRRALGVEVPLGTIFERPTVGQLSEAVAAAERSDASPRITPTGSEGPFPLSFPQRRLWFLAQLKPGSADYNVPMSLRLTGPLRVTRLQEALDALLVRQSALRTVFPAPNGDPQQVVRDEVRCPIELTDVPGTPDERARRLAAMAADEVGRPFDLGQGPLLRARLFRLGPAEHVLILTTHHITVDVQSVDLLVDELSTLYSAACAGTDAGLPDLAIRYADYAVWQRRTASAWAGRARRDYWRERLSGVPALDLPTDRRRPRMATSAGATYGFDLGAPITVRLRELARRLGATTNIVTLAAFALLLSRYSGQTDVAVGSPAVAREDESLERLVGCFMNTVVLRTDLSGDPTFVELVRRVRDTTIGALEHATVPFELVVDDLDVERDTSRSPLFQVAFTHQRARERRLDGFHELAASPYPVRQRTSKFDLTLAIVETPESIRGSWEYRTDLFDAATVVRLAGHFGVLLEAMLADPEQRISVPGLMTAAELGELADWNATAAAAPADACAHELIEAQVDRSPDAVAVGSDGGALSYRQLDERANLLAHWLLERGVGPEAPVGLCVGPGVSMAVGVLGILKAGGAYVPLDPRHPLARLAGLVAGTGASVVVTESGLRSRLGGVDADLVCLDTDDLPRTGRTDRPRVPVRPEHLASAVYPAGRPEGVRIEHRALVDRVRRTQAAAPLGPSDRVLWTALTDALWPLVAGARLVLAAGRAPDPAADVADAIDRHGVTVAELPPRALDRLVRRVATGRARCGSLRLVRTGGEAVHPPGVERFYAVLDAELDHGYGRVEAGGTTRWRCRPGADPTVPVPAGRPFAGTRVYILDRRLNPVPVGVAGEIHVGGPGLARDYLGQPGETARRFVPDPFTGDPAARLFRTGDRGRLRPDGTVEVLGEPPAEAELLRHPDVHEAAVTVGAGRGRLIAYVVTGARSTADDLREHLRASLPEPLVPASYVFLPELPLTADGTLDRAALPEPPADGPATAERAGARTPTEDLLARVWAEVLGLDHVRVDDNFFALGGDSILGMQVVSRVRNEGLWLTPGDLFDAQTVAELARAVTTAKPAVATQDVVTGPVPLTPIQHAFFDRTDAEPGHHCQVVAVPVPADVGDDVLRSGLTHVLTHHDALRTRFRFDAGGWRADTGEPAAADLEVVELADGQAGTIRRAAVSAAVATTLDGPLARGVLLRLPGGARQLLLVVHHLVVDAVSWRILLDDLRTALAQLAAGNPVSLPAKTTSYAYWAERLVDYAGSAAARVDAAYWLPDECPPALPVDHDDGANSAESNRTVTVELDEEVTAALLSGAVPRWHGTSPLEAMAAALTLAVTDWTGAGAARVDMEGHGREQVFDEVDLSRTVGWFTTVYPVWLRRAAADVAGMVGAVREEMRRVPKRGLAYGPARYLTPDARMRARLAAAGSADIVFNYLGGGEFDGPAGAATPVHFGRSGERSHLLGIVGRVDRGRLRFHWSYSANRHRAATIAGVGEAFVRYLREFVRTCVRLDAAGHAAPARYPLADLTQEQLDRVAGRPGIEDLYPLTPIQHGMLFHSLASPGTGMYLAQLSFQLDGAFAERVFREAMEIVLARHPVLRTSVEWQRLRTPHQVVRRDVAVPYRFEDRSADASRFDLAAWMAAERTTEFDLAAAPLLRLTVVRLADDAHHAILTSHHSVLDGWSGSLMLQECWDTYFALVAGKVPEVPSRPPFRDYVAWIGRQDAGESAGYWRGVLDGFRGPTPLPGREGGRPGADTEVVRKRLPQPVSTAVAAYTRQHRLTLGAVVYGAWAVVLSRLTGENDVVFGATLSGRSAPLPDLDQMIGIFANTLPLRVRTPEDGDAVSFLRNVQAQLVDVSRYEYTSLASVQRLVSLRPGAALFDSVVLVQNFPVFLGNRPAPDRPLTIRRGPSWGRTNFPVVVEVLPTTPLTVRVQVDASMVDRRLGAHLAEALCHAIAGLIEDDPAVWPGGDLAGDVLTRW